MYFGYLKVRALGTRNKRTGFLLNVSETMLGQIALFALISINVIKCLFTCVNLQVFFSDWMSEWNGLILNFSILKI